MPLYCLMLHMQVQSQATAEAPKVAYHRSVPFIELALKEGTRGTGRTVIKRKIITSFRIHV